MISFLVWFMFLQSQTVEEEVIHYGEINFSRWKPEPSSDSAQDGGQQEVVYAQVKKK